MNLTPTRFDHILSDDDSAVSAPEPANDVKDVKSAIANFVKLAQAIVDKHYEGHPFQKKLAVEPGRRYARIVIEDVTGLNGHLSRSCFCFVDMTNGDVLKSEGWKKPAMHARGNIYAENPVSGIGPHGALYLK